MASLSFYIFAFLTKCFKQCAKAIVGPFFSFFEIHKDFENKGQNYRQIFTTHGNTNFALCSPFCHSSSLFTFFLTVSIHFAYLLSIYYFLTHFTLFLGFLILDLSPLYLSITYYLISFPGFPLPCPLLSLNTFHYIIPLYFHFTSLYTFSLNLSL